jgi:hypothetical protein
MPDIAEQVLQLYDITPKITVKIPNRLAIKVYVTYKYRTLTLSIGWDNDTVNSITISCFVPMRYSSPGEAGDEK